MNAKVTTDNRTELDKTYDKLWNKLCRDANLNARQKWIVQTYIRKILSTRMNEVQAATEMGYMLALIESESFGTRVGSTRLLRVQEKARQHMQECYGAKCYDGNGVLGYDGCGYERLVNRLESCGVEYDGTVLKDAD